MDLLMKSLDVYLDKYAGKRVNGNVASYETATRHGEALRGSFRRLYTLNYKLMHINNIGDRHIQVLCQDYHDRKLAPHTISGYLSHLRIFCNRIGKKGLVKSIYYYLPHVPKEELRVETVAKKSKSWSEAGINLPEKILEAYTIDPRFAVMIMLQVSFGLRRKEVLQLKPWVVDREDKLALTETKNGRPRSIYIDTPEQRWVLDQAKALTKGKNDAFGWRERLDGKPMEGKDKKSASFKYSTNHYNYLMSKLGISKAVSDCTGHGLRAQFAENSTLLRGLVPPTLGGTGGQMPAGDRDVIRLQLSESMGHSRLSITGPYVGSFGRDVSPDAPDTLREAIEKGLNAIRPDQLQPISPERNIDCACLSAELTAIVIYADPRKIQLLWENHSQRHGFEWVSPRNGSNLAALQAAAISITRVDDDPLGQAQE
ncbi:tyrosine-type recombinase/integrase [Massilia phyllosphaerae]|uniref:tyrosine-type recombinase/integrase n=1 Tax=Massilia phyllosphaerae TaxID=3106034 RepID=UPI002B1CB97E|nr:site-specific integrase [Massilia sp. SGZ-792]